MLTNQAEVDLVVVVVEVVLNLVVVVGLALVGICRVFG